MNHNATLSIIRKEIVELLDHVEDPHVVEKSLLYIYEHFKRLTGISGHDQQIELMAAVPTARGKALGLNYAAQCLLDYQRTAKFLKGIVEAIKDKQKEFPGERIEVFYAGCGPYAPFFVLVAPLFEPEEVHFTLLEVNSNSVDSALRLIHGLNIQDYTSDFYTADAITFEVKEPEKFHLLISETLDALLFRENYVPIMFNLLPQFSSKMSLIPENVSIELSLMKYTKEGEDHEFQRIHTLVDVRASVDSYSGEERCPKQLEPQTVDLSTYDPESYDSLVLDTEIHIYKDIKLNRGESALTSAMEVKTDEVIKQSSIIFTYLMDYDIELKYEVITKEMKEQKK